MKRHNKEMFVEKPLSGLSLWFLYLSKAISNKVSQECVVGLSLLDVVTIMPSSANWRMYLYNFAMTSLPEKTQGLTWSEGLS